jgi:hypothetical protein
MKVLASTAIATVASPGWRDPLRVELEVDSDGKHAVALYNERGLVGFYSAEDWATLMPGFNAMLAEALRKGGAS